MSFTREINEVLKLSGVRVAETVEQPLKAPFKLPDGCPTDWFQLTNSFKDIEQWKAIVHEANSRSDESIKVGDLEEVGYVMISLTDNTIVPIARSDEHHQGYDVFTEYYASEFHLSPSKFQEVFCLPNTTNYPYSKEEAEKLKKALIKCGEYGMNLKTSYVYMGYIDDNFKGKSYDEALITAEEFINGNYGLASFGTQLTNVGERLLKAFQELSKAFENKNARGQISLPALRKAIKTLTTVGKKIPLAGGTLVRDIDKEWMDDVLEQYKQHYIDEKQLENLFFGFGGFRNRFHQILRKNVGDEKLNKLLGSVNTLVDMIGAI